MAKTKTTKTRFTITRTKGPTSATYSRCEKYRYTLEHEFGQHDLAGRRTATIAFLLLNPSTATEEKFDPTVRRCMIRAERMGAARGVIINLFAYRATNPWHLRANRGGPADPVGPMNDAYLASVMQTADMVICGWGNHGGFRSRAAEVLAMAKLNGHDAKLWKLDTTKRGHPMHPLYIGYQQSVSPMHLSSLP